MLTKFLQSHQTSFVIGEIKTETKLNLGLYGILLQQFEIMNASFKLTIEYLQFLLDFMKSIPFTTSSSSETAIIYADVVVNLMFVLKEIFASFSKWRYTYPSEKGEIGNFALLFFFFFFLRTLQPWPSCLSYSRRKFSETSSKFHSDFRYLILTSLSL